MKLMCLKLVWLKPACFMLVCSMLMSSSLKYLKKEKRREKEEKKDLNNNNKNNKNTDLCWICFDSRDVGVCVYVVRMMLVSGEVGES